MRSQTHAHPTAISFRPDAETVAAIDRIQAMSGLQDRSAVLRESVRVMEAQLMLETVVKACALHAAESERVVEEFEMAGDDI
jgi:predicted transcriptional regulator